MKIQITPCPAPRQVQSDRWKPRDCVLRYRAFKDELRLKCLVLPVPVRLIFVLSMPSSWSDKKRAAHDGQPHRQKPDIDNLVKAVMDALLSDDAHVDSLQARKIWGISPAIFIDEF